MLRLLLLMACARCALGDAEAAADPMLAAVMAAGGAARAALCADAAGCAGALWARHWLLTRASCLARVRSVHRAPVLLHRGPEDCRRILNGTQPPDALEALVRFVHPGYAAPASDEEAPAHWQPFDVALVLLADPAPARAADNHSAIYELLPELSSWARYVPAQVPWSLEHAPPPTPARLDPAQYRALDSPLRLLAATVLLPVAALLVAFLLLLRVPERKHADDHEQTLLVAADAPLNDTL